MAVRVPRKGADESSGRPSLSLRCARVPAREHADDVVVVRRRAVPSGEARLPVDRDAGGAVRGPERDGIPRNRRRRGYGLDLMSGGVEEREVAVAAGLDTEAELVDVAVVGAAEGAEVRELGLAAL
jgi:hypothetical protein